MSEPFTSEKASLFVMNGDEPIFMHYTGLRDIICTHTEKTKVCGNCKSLISAGITCTQCGAPYGNAIDANRSIGKTTAVLYGILPRCRTLIGLGGSGGRNSTIHVVYRGCGIPYSYYPNEVFAVLSNIVITRTSIPLAATIHPLAARDVEIIIEIECDFTLVGEYGGQQL